MTTQWTDRKVGYADYLELWCGYPPYPKAPFFLNDPRWQFPDGGDFTCDGRITISDVWAIFEFWFFFPGDSLVRYAPMASFFELTREFYGSWISGLLSLVWWGFVLSGAILILGGLLRAVRGTRR